MKKLLFGVLFILLQGLYFTSVAYAHVLKTDGNIGAVIHIDPEDDPIAGSPTNFYFEFKDREGRFKINDCDCKLSVLENGNELLSQPLVESDENNDSNSAIVSFTFPEKSVYVVRMSGSAKDGTSFQNFSLSYDIRVEREIAKNNSVGEDDNYVLSHWIHFVIAAIAAGIVSLFIIRLTGGKRS